jgi:urease accessory protein
MLIKEKIGNLHSYDIQHRAVTHVVLEWFETNKRILHKKTTDGAAITIKFLKENPEFKEGDILWRNENDIIAIDIKPCEAIVIRPATILEAAFICYEIGNKHLPLFYAGEDLLVPYEAPLYKLLQASGYTLKIEDRKLTNAVKTSVSPHADSGGSTSLFNKILQLTTTS